MYTSLNLAGRVFELVRVVDDRRLRLKHCGEPFKLFEGDFRNSLSDSPCN